MAISTQLHFRLGVPRFLAYRVGWRGGTGAGGANVFASRPVTLFAVHVRDQVDDLLAFDSAAGRVAVDTSLQRLAARGIAKVLERAARFLSSVTRRQAQVSIVVACDSMLDAFGLSVQAGSQSQHGLGVKPGSERILQRKRFFAKLRRQRDGQVSFGVGPVLVGSEGVSRVERLAVKNLWQFRF